MNGKTIFTSIALVLILGSILAIGWGVATNDFVYMTCIGFVLFLAGFLNIFAAEVINELEKDKLWQRALAEARRRKALSSTEEEEPIHASKGPWNM